MDLGDFSMSSLPYFQNSALNYLDICQGWQRTLIRIFSTLPTYGDQGQRAAQISKLGSGDLLVFFAALKPIAGPKRPLIYALIGIFVIDSVVSAAKISREHWHENAHTRRVPGESDIVVRGRPYVSGRLARCIPIGEFRRGCYRVRSDLLDGWGGLNIKDGFIQRSVRLPAFSNAERFYRWFARQKPTLITTNNPYP